MYYSPGDRIIGSQEGARRPVSTKAWETAFQLKGVTHIEEGASDAPLRAVFVEMKEPVALGVVDTAATPAAAASPHRHLRDAVIVSFKGETPRVSFTTRGTVHGDEGTAGADRAYVFELK